MEFEYSVIICTRNRCDVLKRALMHHATLQTTFGVAHEYIIVDNGSTDATREVVEYFATQVPCPVHYVLETRLGHSIALNTGCESARGTKLIFTDDDTLPLPSWFPTIHELFHSKDADWVFGPVIPKWEHGPAPAWYGRETAAFIACLHFGNQVLINDQIPGSFAGANHACKRSKIFDLGLYDPELGLRGDGLSYAGNDDDLFSRAGLAGLTIVYSPEVAVEHLISANRYSKQLHRRNSWLVGKNQFLALQRVPPVTKNLLGIPRYNYSLFADNVYRYISATLQCKRSSAFLYETKIIRFLSLLLTAARNKLSPKALKQSVTAELQN